MPTTYPRYRLCEWLDISKASLAKPNPLTVIGIQTQRAAGQAWCHCHNDGQPMLYATTFLAESAIAVLKAQDANHSSHP